jgi:predicted transcriptional regulator
MHVQGWKHHRCYGNRKVVAHKGGSAKIYSMPLSDTLDKATEVVVAFISNNSISPAELPALIETVHAAMERLSGGAENPPPKRVVSVLKSITPDYLICLEDGKKFKSLKRHLAVLGLTSEQYRLKWNLPSDYPMVAPNYAAKRSSIAKTMGFGQIRPKA